MKTVSKTKNEKKEVVNTFSLKECLVLWKQQAKTGLNYLSGRIANEEKTRLQAFYNTNKKNPKEPDIRVYLINEEGKRDIEVASLWETIAKNESRYLTGTTNENEKLVGWYSKVEDEKLPYIRVYYKEDNKNNDSELPF